MIDLPRRVRKVNRELGPAAEVKIMYSTSDKECKTPLSLICEDEETKKGFNQPLGPQSQWEKNLKKIHEDVYHARAKEKYRLQGGKCSRCGRELRDKGECNHIVHRSKGRDDRLFNLEIVCASMSNGCDFHQREHGLTGQRRT